MITDWNVEMAIKPEDLDAVLKGVSNDGKVSKEAEKILVATIAEAKSKECPMGELKRQYRKDLNADDGLKIAKAIDALW